MGLIMTGIQVVAIILLVRAIQSQHLLAGEHKYRENLQDAFVERHKPFEQ